MNRQRVRLWSRLALYVVAACMAYIAVWLAWMISGEADTTKGSIHVLVALVTAVVVGAPAGFALAMLQGPVKRS